MSGASCTDSRFFISITTFPIYLMSALPSLLAEIVEDDSKKNVPIAFILSSRWQDRAECLGIEITAVYDKI